MSARTFTSWRQSVLMGLYYVIKEKGGSLAQHTLNVNYNVDTDLNHMESMEGRLAAL